MAKRVIKRGKRLVEQSVLPAKLPTVDKAPPPPVPTPPDRLSMIQGVPVDLGKAHRVHRVRYAGKNWDHCDTTSDGRWVYREVER